LWGTFRDDTIRGLGGDDRIDSGAGADRIEGGDGNDRLDGQFGDDVLFGEGGDDTLYETDGGNASLFGGAGKDAIIVEYAHGQAAATITMDGGADDDRLIFRGINRGGDARAGITLSSPRPPGCIRSRWAAAATLSCLRTRGATTRGSCSPISLRRGPRRGATFWR
jgi:Ca2+-binding RTX toxin-like protein